MMSKADARYSSGTWVGNLYQKFEAMCHEVDDIVGQEHLKSLENHVQSVGDNVMKFCSNVKELIPSSFGVSGKHEGQAVNSVESDFDLEEGDGECPSVAKTKQSPNCIQVSDDLHFQDKPWIPSVNEPVNVSSGLQLKQCEDCGPHLKEEKESSGISEVNYPDTYFTVQRADSFTEEKQSPFDASELIAENSDSVTRKEEEFLSSISEFIFPDEDPCDTSTPCMFHDENHKPVDKVLIDASPSASEHSLGSEFLLKEETVKDTVNDSLHECSLESKASLKEEIVHDSPHKQNPGSEFQMKEDIVNDSLPKSYFDVLIDNVPYSLLASSVTSSDSETSNVRLTSSISSPLLDSSDHGATEIGSASTVSAASQSSESSSCFLSAKANGGDTDSSLASSSIFTDIPIISHSENVGHHLENMELPVKLDLGGSCVFVKSDSNHTTLSSVERSWLSKKTIRGRLSARKKLEKEYKQLAIWYCDIDAEFDEVSGEKLISSSHNKHLAAQGAQESEWELL